MVVDMLWTLGVDTWANSPSALAAWSPDTYAFIFFAMVLIIRVALQMLVLNATCVAAVALKSQLPRCVHTHRLSF